MDDETTEQRGRRLAGQILFAGAFVLVAVALVLLLPDQTVWKSKTKFVAQPRFWSAVGVIGMAVFGALHLWQQPRRRPTRTDLLEGRIWFQVLEYALWFLAYVWIVPVIGYLPTTLVFAPLLAWRLGYRHPRMLWIAAAFGFSVVVVFKTFLEVKIPGGATYEYLPGALRSFFILNF